MRINAQLTQLHNILRINHRLLTHFLITLLNPNNPINPISTKHFYYFINEFITLRKSLSNIILTNLFITH